MSLAHSSRRWRRTAVVFAAASALVLVGCGTSAGEGGEEGVSDVETSPDDGDEGGEAGTPAAESPRKAANELIAVAVQDPGAFDYITDTKTAIVLWIPSMIEPLLFFDEDGEAHPAVADEWEISDDGLIYDFHIRDAKFSDGTQVTADDVVFSMKEMQQSPLSRLASVFDPVESIEATDEENVRITLKRPSQAFFQGMGDFSGLVQPEAAAADLPTNPVGTGPYKLEKYVPQDSIVLVENEHYWGDPPGIPKITIRIIEDENAAMLAMQAGEADIFVPAGAQFWEQITKEGLDVQYDLVTYPQDGEPTYGVINQDLPLDKRQTIAQVFNRDNLKDLFNAPWGVEAACTFGSIDRSWYREYTGNGEESCAYPYDPEGVMEKIQAEGWGDDEIVFTSLTDVGDLKPPAEIMIAEMQAAGFNVTNNAIDLARYSDTVFGSEDPDFDVTVMAGGDTPASLTCPGGSPGWQTYCNPEYDELLAKADEALSLEEYDDYMFQAAQLLAEDAVIVPLLSKLSAGLVHPDLNGWAEPKVGRGLQLAELTW